MYNTDLVEFDDLTRVHSEGPNTTDTLTIDCDQPTPGAIALPATGVGTTSGGDLSWLMATASLVGGTAFLTLATWSARQRSARA